MQRKFSRALAPWVLGVFLASHLTPVLSQATVAGFTPGSFGVSGSGAAQYNIPIAVPPGIPGMEPKLAIGFSSQGGNGLLGLGAGLGGLSAVHRCGRTLVQDGMNAGVFYDTYDRYCLDGQRLVLISTNKSYGEDGAEYRTERESFSRIVSYGSAGTGPAWFRAWTKSGQILDYGNLGEQDGGGFVSNGSNSRITAQGKASVRAWALNRVRDTASNYVAFKYEVDEPNGDYRPDRIDYTGNASVTPAVTPFASVRFSYQDRTDSQEGFVGGSRIKPMKRMTNVKTYMGETVVRDYRFAYDYSPDSGPSRLLSVTECNGAGTQCLSPTSFTWQNPSGDAFTTNSFPGQAGKLGDVNRDGMADVVYSSGASLYVRLSNGTAFGSAAQIGTLPVTGTYWDEIQGWVNVYATFAVGDINGDGYADIVISNGTALLATSSGSFSSVSWSGAVAGQLGDVNGDGMADLVYASGTSVYVAYSTGTGFGTGALVGTLPIVGYNESDPIYARYMVGDVDGNGRADIVLTSGNAYLSSMSGLSSVTWANAMDGELADVNGDGMADLVYSAGGAALVRTSTGAGFNSPGLMLATLPIVGYNEDTPIYASIVAGDVDGNGRADAVTSGGNSVLSKGKTPDLMTKVTSGLGSETTISYKPLTDSAVYEMEATATWPVRDLKAEGTLQVVFSASVPNLVGGAGVTKYFYRGAKAHLRGGGFLGFRQVEATDDADSGGTGIKTTTTSRQEYPYKGLPLSVAKAQGANPNPPISLVTYEWTDTAYTSNTTGKYHKSELLQSVETTYELTGGSPITTVTTTNTYDSYGNALTVTVDTGGGYSKLTTNTFTNNTTNWFLGRLTRSTVKSTKP